MGPPFEAGANMGPPPSDAGGKRGPPTLESGGQRGPPPFEAGGHIGPPPLEPEEQRRSETASSCVTVSGPTAGQLCVFPFRYSGRVYTECADWVFGGQRGPWCSTRVNSFGMHVKGQYGFCADTCFGKEPEIELSNKIQKEKDSFVFQEELPIILDNPL